MEQIGGKSVVVAKTNLWFQLYRHVASVLFYMTEKKSLWHLSWCKWLNIQPCNITFLFFAPLGMWKWISFECHWLFRSCAVVFGLRQRLEKFTLEESLAIDFTDTEETVTVRVCLKRTTLYNMSYGNIQKAVCCVYGSSEQRWKGSSQREE